MIKECWLWRGNHYDGKLGAWQPCYGFKPESRFGGNEYNQLVPKIDKVHIVLGVDAHGTDLIKCFAVKEDALEYIRDIFCEELEGYAFVTTQEMEIN